MEVDGAGPGPGSAAVRAKDRLPNQIRPLSCQRSLLQRADGSAQWTQDGSIVLAAVHGPVQAPGRREDAERAILEVQLRPRSGVPGGPQEAEYEEVVRATLEGLVVTALHPRTQITIIIQVLQADGALLSCALNAAAAALVDAGIPMITMLASVTAAFSQQGVLLLDPDAAEEEAAAAVICIAYAHRHILDSTSSGASVNTGAPQLLVGPGIVASHTRGAFSVEQYALALDACRRGCEIVAKFFHMVLLRGFRESLKPLQEESAE